MAKTSAKSRRYEVRAGHSIFVGSGVKAVAGDIVELSDAEAKMFLKNENVKVYIGDDNGDDDD